jgi:hypothetical protein
MRNNDPYQGWLLFGELSRTNPVPERTGRDLGAGLRRLAEMLAGNEQCFQLPIWWPDVHPDRRKLHPPHSSDALSSGHIANLLKPFGGLVWASVLL